MREDQGGVKINLTAASEGIEGDVLARPPSPVDPSIFKYKKPKRGRPKKVRPEESEASTSQGEAPSDVIDVQVSTSTKLEYYSVPDFMSTLNTACRGP